MAAIRQHKSMAEGHRVRGERDDFGVPSFASVNCGRESMDRGDTGAILPDRNRSAGLAVERGRGRMPGTPHSDHGPHDHTEA